MCGLIFPIMCLVKLCFSFTNEVAIGPAQVMWLEWNADFVTLTALLW